MSQGRAEVAGTTFGAEGTESGGTTSGTRRIAPAGATFGAERTESAGLSLRTQRLRVAWLLAVPFLLLARPSSYALLLGILLTLPGLLLRGSAAGCIEKDRRLATGGPYRRLRHPLYLGSFLLGLGLSVAGGRWWFPFLFAGVFIWAYRRTIRAEERELGRRFGQAYAEYWTEVPAIVPRRRPSSTLPPSPGFSFRLYRRNKEWQALVGAFLGFGVLWAKMALLG